MKDRNSEQEKGGTHVTIKLDPQLNAFIERKTRESMLSKKKQILFILKQLMLREG